MKMINASSDMPNENIFESTVDNNLENHNSSLSDTYNLSWSGGELQEQLSGKQKGSETF